MSGFQHAAECEAAGENCSQCEDVKAVVFVRSIEAAAQGGVAQHAMDEVSFFCPKRPAVAAIGRGF